MADALRGDPRTPATPEAASPDVRVTPLHARDAAALSRLLRRNREMLASVAPGSERFHDPVLLDAFIACSAAWADAGQGWYFGARAGSNLVGGAGLLPADGLEAALEVSLWLDRDHIGSGVGAASMRALLRIGRERIGARLFQVRCGARNRHAIAFFQRLGFRPDNVSGDTGDRPRMLMTLRMPTDSPRADN